MENASREQRSICRALLGSGFRASYCDVGACISRTLKGVNNNVCNPFDFYIRSKGVWPGLFEAHGLESF